MFSINLDAQDEYQWLGEENPSPATFPKEKGRYPLYHQWRTYNAEAPIIVNTYNTGTGKTKAALLRLLKRARDIGFERLWSSQHNALLIAPTNELLAQHVTDAKKFCEENDLPYRVVPITKEDLDTLEVMPGFSEERLRRGAVLHTILDNASKVDEDTSKRATLYVVNPDIFYYALFFCYSPYDRSALFTNFFTLFNYLVIDELHYYTPKQLSAFLFFMKLSQHEGYIGGAKKRQFCILTATPRPQVARYLERLGVPIDWIVPGEIDPADALFVKPVRALAPVELKVYHTEELQQNDVPGGLLPLVVQQRSEIRRWLDQGLEGAIISGSLGNINRIHHALQPLISPEEMGRITGPQWREDRSQAKKKGLILATPTVDIGYNFERENKQRQNIDFLLLDAYSGDELIQRLGRAGRVLGKEVQDQPGIVLAVVDPAVYTLLQQHYDGQAMDRATLGRLAANEMRPRNDLYAYIKAGAILEIMRPLHFIGAGMSEAEMPDLEVFLQEMQHLFEVDHPFTYGKARGKVREFEQRKEHYGRLTTIPREAFEGVRLLLKGQRSEKIALPALAEKCAQALVNRLQEVQKRKEKVGVNVREVMQWFERDLRCYYIDRARFSFRDSFQPPLALVYDPERLHSSRTVASHDALHVLKYYEACFYATGEEWEQATGERRPPEAKEALAYCKLQRFREKPLQLGFKLNANGYTQDEWEAQFAYQITALYGLEIDVLSDHSGLDSNLLSLVRTQFIPAFVSSSEFTSRTASEIRKLQKRARFFPLSLKVTFADGRARSYLAILGTMAFQVWAEIPFWVRAIDRRKTQLEDDTPFIC